MKRQKSRHIHCALCLNCRVFRNGDVESLSATRRVRCAKDQWRSASGRIMVYEYRTLPRRTMDACPFYAPDDCESEKAALEAIFKDALNDQGAPGALPERIADEENL